MLSREEVGAKEGNPGASPEVDFRSFYHALREKAWVVILAVSVTAFMAGVYVLRSPRIYASTATVEVEQKDQNIIAIQRVNTLDTSSLESLRTVEQSLASRLVVERVLLTNNLATDARFLALWNREATIVDRISSKIFGEEADTNKVVSLSTLTTRIAKLIDVKLRRGTRLIDLKVEHTDPEMAAMIANSTVKEYLTKGNEDQNASSLAANKFLSDEAKRLKEKLVQSEDALQAYRESVKSVSLEDRQNIVVQKLKEISQKTTEAKSLRIRYESDYGQIQKLGSNIEALLGVQSVASDPTVQRIQQQVAQLESEFASIKQRYKEKHPKFIQAQSQLNEWQAARQNAVLKIPQTIRGAFEGALASETALAQALKEQEVLAMELDKQTVQYQKLQREADADRRMYDTVATRLKETYITKDIQAEKVRLVQPAYAISSPVRPRRTLIMGGALILGFLGGAFLVLLIDQLDSSLKAVDQTEEYLKLPVLSAVPQIGRFVSTNHLVIQEDPKSAGAEAFRTLRTTLSMLGRVEDRRIFLFTSALPSEGKTFNSLNFAVSLAQQGLRTLVIDGDLRRPTVENALVGKKKRDLGVTDYLTGKKTFLEIIQKTEIENFSYIPAGTTAPNPAELLAEKGFGGLIAEALKHYDRIVVDSAPVHAVSDTFLMLDRVQTVCLVTRANKTPRKASLRAVELLKKYNAPLAGVILNRLPRRSGGSYGYYSYYDYTYYGKYSSKGVYGAK